MERLQNAHMRRRRALRLTFDAPLLPEQIRWRGSVLTAESENVRKWTQERKRERKERWRDQRQKSGRKRRLSQPAFITRDCIRRRNRTGCADNSPFHFSAFRRARFALEPDGLAHFTLLSSTEFTPNTLALRNVCVPLACLLAHLNNNSFFWTEEGENGSFSSLIPSTLQDRVYTICPSHIKGARRQLFPQWWRSDLTQKCKILLEMTANWDTTEPVVPHNVFLYVVAVKVSSGWRDLLMLCLVMFLHSTAHQHVSRARSYLRLPYLELKVSTWPGQISAFRTGRLMSDQAPFGCFSW